MLTFTVCLRHGFWYMTLIEEPGRRGAELRNMRLRAREDGRDFGLCLGVVFGCLGLKRVKARNAAKHFAAGSLGVEWKIDRG